MKTEERDRDRERIKGVHTLFKTINESIIKRHRDVTPYEILNLILDPGVVECDAVVSIQAGPDSGGEYFLSMEHIDGLTAYHMDPDSMPRGRGGFLHRASTVAEPCVFSKIKDEVTQEDIKVLPWISDMKSALVVPAISVTGRPATTILFARREDLFNTEYVLRSVIMIYAMTNILLNMSLRRETDRINRVLDSELQSIGRIQREFLPRELPMVAGFDWAVYYATSTRAGGDYYDFFKLNDKRVGVIIADVAGHGSPAAVVMAMTRLLLHTYPGEAGRPGEVLAHVNRLLMGNLLPGQFVTAFYSVLDPRGRRLLYSNAGHCPPQLYRSARASVERLSTNRGLPLGVSEQGGFEERAVVLERGDVLVFYTDGLREAMNRERELYGEERLRRVLKASASRPAEEIKNAILGDVLTFCDGAPLRDDLTIVVLKVLE